MKQCPIFYRGRPLLGRSFTVPRGPNLLNIFRQVARAIRFPAYLSLNKIPFAIPKQLPWRILTFFCLCRHSPGGLSDFARFFILIQQSMIHTNENLYIFCAILLNESLMTSWKLTQSRHKIALICIAKSNRIGELIRTLPNKLYIYLLFSRIWETVCEHISIYLSCKLYL